MYVPPVPDVEFIITSPLCLAQVLISEAYQDSLQSLLQPTGTREFEYALAPLENLLLEPPLPVEPVPEDAEPYGKACTNDTDAVFREGDSVSLEFKLAGREPWCFGIGIWPWDWEVSCGAYKDASPSPSQPIDIEIIDGVSGTKNSTTYGDGPFDHTMNVTVINPFAPFSRQLDLQFSRAFDGAVIDFARYVLVVGSLPEQVPQVATCVEIKILRRVRAEPSGRPPRHRCDASSMEWRCRFLTARRSQHGSVIAEK